MLGELVQTTAGNWITTHRHAARTDTARARRSAGRASGMLGHGGGHTTGPAVYAMRRCQVDNLGIRNARGDRPARSARRAALNRGVRLLRDPYFLMPGAFSTAWPPPGSQSTTRRSRLSVGSCLLTSSSRASRSRSRSNGVMSSVTNASVSSMRIHAAHCAPLLTLRGHSVQRRQLIATWSMGVPVLTAMYSRAIGSTSLG